MLLCFLLLSLSLFAAACKIEEGLLPSVTVSREPLSRRRAVLEKIKTSPPREILSMEALLGYRKPSDFQSPPNYGPPSQGIKGDYFDFWPSEMALISKLNAICVSPSHIPKMLPSENNLSSSNSITSVDDPCLLFQPYTEEDYESFGLPPPPSKRKSYKTNSEHSPAPQKKLPKLNGRKNWEGEEIVLIIDPTSSSSEIGDASESNKSGRSSLSSDIRSGAVSPTAVESAFITPKRRGWLAASRKVSSKKLVTFVGDGVSSLSNERLHSPGHESQISTESSNLYLDFTNRLKQALGNPEQRRIIIQEFLRNKGRKRVEDEFFMRLASEKEIWEFTEQQKFSLDGDFLFRRILRERTRLQMKKDMFGNERDFYVKIHGRSKKVDNVKSKPESDSIYFAI